ncbi:MAG: tetratricopeptide repeat protein [Pseudomonadota bacterium]|nr:MAG: tetratricopeptide repeat protein [Pseudomonadota bacterium]
MSLINDALRDLDRRSARGGSGQPHPLPAAFRPQPRWRWPWWLLAAAAAGGFLHLTLSERPATPDGPAALIAQAQYTPHNNATEPSAPTRATPINPPVANDPAKAREAEAQVADQPLPSERTATDPTGEPDQRDSGQSADHEPAAPEEAPREPVDGGGEEALAANQDELPPTATRIVIEPATNRPDDALLPARRALARGQTDLGIWRLRALLQQQPDAVEARRLLAGTLIAQGRHDEAAAALEDGLARSGQTDVLAEMLGRLLIERGQVQRALALLRTHAPALSDAPDYHLLLAAAERQAGHHQPAAERYRKLTAIVPGRAAAWVGLGASLEALQRPQQAHEAYLQALNTGNDPAVRFARQRLRALQPTTGAPP